MRPSLLDRIRNIIRQGLFDFTAHAVEEMGEDELSVLDVEGAILSGQVVRVDRADTRGPVYVIEGKSADEMTTVGVVGRFKSHDRFLIITVYEVIGT